MAFMSGSKGKGVRRFPGREGGKGKSKGNDWGKQAVHAVALLEQIPEPRVTLMYVGKFEDKTSKKIYKLDQQLAKKGIDYFVEYLGYYFAITVSAEHEQVVNKIISGLGR